MEFKGMEVLWLLRHHMMFAMVQYGNAYIIAHCALMTMLNQGIDALWAYVGYSNVPIGGT